MKKYLLLAASVITAIGVHAEFSRLVFRTIDGNTQSVGLTDLNITFSEGEMIATGDGESVKISLNSLSSMEFDNNQASVNEILGKGDVTGRVSIFTTDGKHIGDYDSMAAACSSLTGGIYLLKTENGFTSKVKINL